MALQELRPRTRSMHSRHIHTWPEMFEALARSKRALKALSTAHTLGAHPNAADECRALQDALRATAFGQEVDPKVLPMLLPSAEHLWMQAGDSMASDEGLMVLLSGAASASYGHTGGARQLQIYVEKASNLVGGTEHDTIDPYVIIRMGDKKLQTQTETDAGSNPVFHWTAQVPYEGEAKIDFVVMEEDDYSRNDVLGSATIHRGEFKSKDGLSTVLELAKPRKKYSMLDSSAAGFLEVTLSWVSAKVDPQAEAAAAAVSERAETGGSTEAEQPRPVSRDGRAGSKGPSAQPFEPGQYVGMDGQSAVVQALEDCDFLFVPRSHVDQAQRHVARESTAERGRVLRQWFPGAKGLDTKPFDTFASCFQVGAYPRGHVFTTAGAKPTFIGEARQGVIHMILTGSCRAALPSHGTSVQLGVLTEGQLIGAASCFLGVPEPISVVADEPVTTLWLSIGDKPPSSWPRDVVSRLMACLQAQTEWHSKRALAIFKRQSMEEDAKIHVHPPGFKDSPFLKNKDTENWRPQTSWKVQTLADRFESWSPVGLRRPTTVPLHGDEGTKFLHRPLSSALLGKSMARPKSSRQVASAFSFRDLRSGPDSPTSALKRHSANASAGALIQMQKAQTRLARSGAIL